jgi:hypothetical protein
MMVDGFPSMGFFEFLFRSCAGFLKVCQVGGFVKASPAIVQDRGRGA